MSTPRGVSHRYTKWPDLLYGQAVAQAAACLFFFCLDFLRLRHLRLRCHLLHDHFQRGNEVDFGTLGIFCGHGTVYTGLDKMFATVAPHQLYGRVVSSRVQATPVCW